MFLAEAPSLGGGELLIILVVLLAIFAAALGVAIAGSIWAYQAGRGSSRAAIGFGIAVVVELITLTLELAGGGGVIGLLVLAALITQGGLFYYGKTATPKAPDDTAP